MPALHHIAVGGDDLGTHGIPGMEVCSIPSASPITGLPRATSTRSATSASTAGCTTAFRDGRALDRRAPQFHHGGEGTALRARHSSRHPCLRGVPFVDPAEPVTRGARGRRRAPGRTNGRRGYFAGRVGRDAWREHQHPQARGGPAVGRSRAGLHSLALRQAHRLLGSDAVHDPTPSPAPIEDWPIPVHMCALASMGRHLLDTLYFTDLETACAAERRWEFLLTRPRSASRGHGLARQSDRRTVTARRHTNQEHKVKFDILCEVQRAKPFAPEHERELFADTIEEARAADKAGFESGGRSSITARPSSATVPRPNSS